MGNLTLLWDANFNFHITLTFDRSKPQQKIFTCGEDIEQNNIQVVDVDC